MVSQEDVYKQLEEQDIKIGYWGHTELNELAKVLTPNERISHIVNGYYENGFAMLVSTDHRLLLIDKKPLNYLNVDDFRFDMINQLDYKHRLFKSLISVSAGSKDLQFASFNQTSLRKLLDCVQCRMIEIKEEKKDAAEKQHSKLDQLDQTLKNYIQAQLRQAGAATSAGFVGDSFSEKLIATDDSELDSRTALKDYLRQVDESPDRYIKTGSLLPKDRFAIYLHPAKVAFAKLPLFANGRR